jgi:two-component system, chemotaxis family, protein-glutamate methylesterase/glutaminase
MAVRRTRILIVDDSVVMRTLLRSVVCAEDGLEVAGTAADGESALNSVQTLHPDLVLMDVEMPVMDGLATLKRMRARGHKMPVIMCSSLTQRGASVTIEALACGASDYVTKPSGQSGREAALQILSRDLIPKIQSLTSRSQSSFSVQPVALMTHEVPFLQAPLSSSVPVALAIGVSTGGPAALDVLLPALPASFPLPVFIVQHMPELFTGLLAARLNERCPLHVQEAAEGVPVRAGCIYIAKGNWHMAVLAASHSGSPATLHLSQGPQENHCRPAVDVLFRSVAAVYGAGALAVVLTGMGADGMMGCRSIRAQGGSVLAQDEATSAVWGMPGAVIHAGLAQRVLPLDAIVPEILRLVCRPHAEANELHGSVA